MRAARAQSGAPPPGWRRGRAGGAQRAIPIASRGAGRWRPHDGLDLRYDNEHGSRLGLAPFIVSHR